MTFDPPEAWPLKNTTYGGTFPHPIKSVRALTYSPFAHEMLLDFAQHVIATENLGTRDGTRRTSSSSASRPTDYVGHYYGPDSMEVADNMVRLDRSLAAFPRRARAPLRRSRRGRAHRRSRRAAEPGDREAARSERGRRPHRPPHARSATRTRIADLPPTRIEIERNLARRLGVPFDRRRAALARAGATSSKSRASG